jgi:tetratricopeptide (TPR) repeat protein
LEELIGSYPRQSVVHNQLGLTYAVQGHYEKATEAMRQSQLLLPSASAYGNLVNFRMALQRFDDTRQTIHEAQLRKRDIYSFHLALYGLAFLAGDSAGMEQEQQWFAAKPSLESFGLSLASDTEAFAGRLTQARELNTRAADSFLRTDSKEGAALQWERDALREAAFGEFSEARRAADMGMRLYSASEGVRVEAALAYAMAGDSSQSESLVRELNERRPLDTQMQSLWLPLIRAQLALNRKVPAAAIKALQPATPPIEYGNVPFLMNPSCLWTAYIRGEADLAAGQGGAAAAEFQKILDHSGMVWNCWTGSLARLGIARANALVAKNSQGADADAARVRALAAYKDFLARWKDADPEIPIFRRAKAEYSKLP